MTMMTEIFIENVKNQDIHLPKEVCSQLHKFWSGYHFLIEEYKTAKKIIIQLIIF